MTSALSLVSNTTYLSQDISQSKMFLNMLEPRAEFTFQTFDDNPKRKSPKLAKVLHGTFDQHYGTLIDLNNQGAGVFVMVNRGDGVTLAGNSTCRTNNNVIGIRSIFIDLDDEASVRFDAVMGSAVKPSIVVESSTGKYHCYWLVDNCELNKFSQVQKAFISKYQSDQAVNDLARVMRMPGFYHQKNESVMTILLEDMSTQATSHDLNDIVIRNGIDLSASKPVAPLAVVDNVIPEGGRNVKLTQIAGSMHQRRLSQDEISTKLMEINQSKCMPPLADNEVQSIVKSICRYPVSINSNELAETLTDTGNADRFAKSYNSTVKYVPDWGKFIIFNGLYWKVDSVNQVMELAKQTARDIYADGVTVDDNKLKIDIARHSRNSQQLQRIKAMIELSKSIGSMIVNSSELNRDDMLLCVKNGVVDLRDGSFRSGRSEDYITQVAPVEFDVNATCPRFEQFIEETFVGDSSVSESMKDHVSIAERSELMEYMKKSLGYCLTGRTDEQCLFFAYGAGANGKTTLINVLLNLLGNDFSAQTPMDTLMVKPAGNSSSNHLARLQNVRFVASTEVEDGAKISESLIKQMTGGDVIAARLLYKEFVEFKPKFKLFIAGNHKPIIKGDDHGIWRRIKLVPFEITVTAEKLDSRLPEQLHAELSGILNWLIEGCKNWHQTGLKQAQLVSRAVSEYKEEMDTLGIWITDCCVEGAGFSIRASDMYESYKKWSDGNGFSSMCSSGFYRKLADRYDKKRGSGGNYYHGIKLKPLPY